MTEKQIIDRLDSINLSLKQKKDLLGVIKDITANSSNNILDVFLDFTKENITIYGKPYTFKDNSSDNDLLFVIYNKELHNILYNSLWYTNKIVYITTFEGSTYSCSLSTYFVSNDMIDLNAVLGRQLITISIRNQ